MLGRPRLEIKSPEQLLVMRRAGLVVGRTLEVLRRAVRPGVSTADLDALAEDSIRSAGAVPSFQGYQGFPASICASVNDEVVHGIPGGRVLAEGDLVSLDCGAIVEGWHGDAAITVAVGAGTTPEAAELDVVTERALWDGIAAARAGGRVGDISRAVEASVLGAGEYGIVEDYTGHGIGTAMHLPPDVPNYSGPRGPRLVPGLALAVEPMITLGTAATRTLEDDWTVVTQDGSWAAHHEHTFVLTERGAWVLTALDGGEAQLTARGAAFGPLAD